jgi:hypothetical protein
MSYFLYFNQLIWKNNTANLGWSRYSELFGKKRDLDNKRQQEENQEEGKYLNVCSRLTHAVYEGLDLRVEIMSVKKQGLGDTVLLWDDENSNNDNYSKTLVGIGICHCGQGLKLVAIRAISNLVQLSQDLLLEIILTNC